MMKRFLATFGFLFGMLWSADAFAQACTVNATDMNFGTITGLAGATADATATFSTTCTAGQDVLLCYHLGRGGGQGFGAGGRTLTNGGFTATLELYSDAARTQVWRTVTSVANAQGTFPMIVPSGNNVTRSQTIYGRLTIGTGPPGVYSTPFTATTDDRVFADYVNNIPAGNRNCTTAHAAQAGVGFNITATIASYCDVTGGTLDFGTSGPIVTNLDVAGSINVGCTAGTNYAISLDDGQNALTGQRRMTAGGNFIPYDLYTDAARSTMWRGAVTATATGTGTGATIPVYGRIPPQGAPPPGAYSDTIVVTVTY